MGKGLGIASLVLVFISFPVPIVGTWIGYLALILAALAALAGNKSWVIAATVVAAIKMYFLSPGLMATMYIPFTGGPAPIEAFAALILTTALTALPIIALLFRPAFGGIAKQFGLVKSD